MIKRLSSVLVCSLALAGCAVASEGSAEPGEDMIEQESSAALSVPSFLPGTVLSVEQMEVTASVAAVGHAKKVRYLSTDPSGKLIVVSGVVLSPKLSIRLANPGAASKVVAWAHGTAGLADHCAPSNQASFDVVEAGIDGMYAHTLASYLAQGWTVAASDYPGLGTAGPATYLVAGSEGRAVIDSVRAARRLNPFLSNDWVVVGHSQGGHAALFASELASTYGQGLDLKGTVAIAPAASLEVLAPAFVGTPLNALVVWMIYGLAATDPTVVPEQILAAPALAQSNVLATGCANETIVAFGALGASDLLVGGALPPAIVAKLAANNPGQQPNGAPVLFVQGDLDFVIPAPITQALHAQACTTNPQPLALNLYAGADHGTVVTSSSADVLAYIADRFAGVPAPSSCP